MLYPDTKASDISQSDKLFFLQAMQNINLAEDIITEAIINKRSDLWKELQYALFSMNLNLMENGFAIGSERASLENSFRNTIERMEQKQLNCGNVPEEIVDPNEFLLWLKNKIFEHRVNHHELFNYFDKDDLNNEELRYFLANYRINMQRFHLHVAAYSLFVPFQMREELYENLYDEFGQGNFDDAHPNLFEPLMDYFGGVHESDLNAETCHLLNTKMNLCWFSGGLHYGMGGMGALELSIPLQQKRILAHLRRKGLSEKLVKFFVVHCELDEAHGDGWFAAGMPYTKDRKHFEMIHNGAMRMLEARAGVYDGVLEGIQKGRDAARDVKTGKFLEIAV